MQRGDINPIVDDIRSKIQTFKRKKSEIDEFRQDRLDINIDKDLLNSYKSSKNIEKVNPSPSRSNNIFVRGVYLGINT